MYQVLVRWVENIAKPDRGTFEARITKKCVQLLGMNWADAASAQHKFSCVLLGKSFSFPQKPPKTSAVSGSAYVPLLQEWATQLNQVKLIG